MSLKMRSEVLDEVVKRLRSGEYKQGQTVLRRTGHEGPDLFCCLGIICEMAVEEGVITRKPPGDAGGVHLYVDPNGEENSSYLPGAVVEWAGVVSDIEKEQGLSEYYYEQRGAFEYGSSDSLAVLNDEGMPFPHIADWMEANVERV